MRRPLTDEEVSSVVSDPYAPATRDRIYSYEADLKVDDEEEEGERSPQTFD